MKKKKTLGNIFYDLAQERRRKYIGAFLSEEHTPDVTNILVTGDNVLHRRRVY